MWLIPLVLATGSPKIAMQTCVLYVRNSAPFYNQTDVPIDSWLAVELATDHCLSDEGLSVFLQSNGTDVFHQDFAPGEFSAPGVLLVEPGLLQENTAYTLQVIPSFSGGTDIFFTTGSHTVSPIAGQPQWTGLRLTQNECSGDNTLNWGARPATDPDGMSYLELNQEGTLVQTVLSSSLGATLLWNDPDVDPSLCYTLVQVGPDGTELSSEENCTDVFYNRCGLFESCNGCNSSGSTDLLLPLLLGLGALKRRS